MSASIGGRSFASQKAAKAFCNSLLFSVDKRPQRLASEHQPFAMALFRLHPDFAEKCGGRAISHFEVHPYTGGYPCFFVVFVGGDRTHFSWKKCIAAAFAPKNTRN